MICYAVNPNPTFYENELENQLILYAVIPSPTSYWNGLETKENLYAVCPSPTLFKMNSKQNWFFVLISSNIKFKYRLELSTLVQYLN